jgi:hypothetical protein
MNMGLGRQMWRHRKKSEPLLKLYLHNMPNCNDTKWHNTVLLKIIVYFQNGMK